MKLTIDLARAATGGTVLGDWSVGELRVVTDTRSLQPGDTYVALRGERFDGHDFIGEARRRGAASIVVDRREAYDSQGPAALLVDDTLQAYMALAGAARNLFKGQVVAITGSAGKTTTKVFLAELLRAHYGDRVAVAPANENNEIGVSKLLLGLSNERHDVAIVEMGARKVNDIATLVKIAKPETGILTNVGEAHLEIFGSRERLADEKWALFSGGASAILNADDPISVARAPQLPRPPHWFSVRDDSAEISPAARATVLVGTRRLALFEERGSGTYDVRVTVPGSHNRSNLAAAVAGALQLGVPAERIAEAIPNVRLPEGRFQTYALPAGWRIIYDAYNANASGTIAALDAFAEETPRRGIAVLGSMAELGDESVALHERVGAHAAGRVDVLLVGGDFADAMARGAERAGLEKSHIVRVTSNAEAAAWLRAHARRGDAVLLKGSRKYKLEEIVEELMA